jgi:hypothetical protein
LKYLFTSSLYWQVKSAIQSSSVALHQCKWREACCVGHVQLQTGGDVAVCMLLQC